MLRQLLRTLAGLNKHDKSGAILSRADPRNFLNMSFVETISKLDAERRRFTLTNTDTKVKVNYYLQTVFKNDIQRSLDILQLFKAKCNVNRTHTSFPRNVQIYTSCLCTLISHLASNVGGDDNDLAEIRLVIKEVSELPHHMLVSIPELQTNLIQKQLMVALIRHLDLVVKKSKQHTFARSIVYELAKQYSLNPHSFIEYISIEYPDLKEAAHSLWPSLEQHASSNGSPFNIAPFLNKDGSMSFDGLCEFIMSSRFNMSGDKRPMYAIYDSIDETSKSYFLQEYMLHNRERQVIVEQYCGALQRSFSAKQFNSGVTQFNRIHNAWLTRWHELVAKTLSSDSLLSNRVFKKFAFFLKTVPTDRLVSLVLTKMFAFTLVTGQIETITLVRALSSSFKKSIMADKTLKPIYHQLDHYLSEEDAIEFFGALIKVVIDTCKVPQDLMKCSSKHESPLFSSGYGKGTPSSPLHKAGVVILNDDVMRSFQSFKDILFCDSYLLPMLCPPVPWTSPHRGGFLDAEAPLVRSSDLHTTLAYVERAHETGQLSSLYNLLSALGSLAWTINCEMLEVFNEVLKADHGFLKLPPPIHLLRVESIARPARDSYTSEEDYTSAMRSYRKETERRTQEYNDRRGLRITYELMNKVANAFGVNGDIMYLPHNVDFRGRAYPAVSFLSHHNEDLIRSLLMFWEAKPLGSNGYDWIKYQLANLYCKSKLSMQQSINFVKEHKTEILEAASEPLKSSSWWVQGDNPWQCLALCKEIKMIEDSNEPPELFKSRIPIHQDGTCNGLQHYAALGADDDAARSVNLLPTQERNDVYSSVLRIVEGKVANDTLSGDKKLQALATKSQTLLSRKLIKQTVMTTVYGVTFFGASRQIEARVDEVTRESSPKEFKELSRMQIASYIASVVLKSITELFAGAKTIQDWLIRNCIRCINSFEAKDLASFEDFDFFSSKRYRPMMWSSLSGFPVVQPYKHDPRKEIVTPLQKITFRQKTKLGHINIRKQINALAPNFIHSLDAIHLQMTCLAAKGADISFAAVHDSFWTHASDVETLSRVIREEFVRLHQSLIIENLREDMKYSNRNAFQLVWVENHCNKDFIQELNALRVQHNLKKCRKKEFWNSCLKYELSNPTNVNALVKHHKPQLWFQTKTSSKTAEQYDEDTKRTREVSVKTHTPILVPVEVLPEPPLGHFDVTLVLKSRYFFS